MKIALGFISLFIILSTSNAQEYDLQSNLDATVSETSGLIILNNVLITHNDSGNTAQLYEIDKMTGDVTRTVTITNATNIDWEDITHDDTYIYIGDFGNNEGDRTNLKIYRVLISDYLNNTAVTADVINFTYSDQTDFTTRPFNTNFDAEALIHYNNSLYIFTKNWTNNQSHIYQLPKTIGTQTAIRTDDFNSGGLITGATFNVLDNRVLLCGYDEEGPFLTQLSGFSNGLFSNGSSIKTSVLTPEGYSPQTEGIVGFSATEYYVSTEALSPDLQGLFRFDISTLNTPEVAMDLITFYPNPAKTEITINKPNCITKIYSISGQLIKDSKEMKVDISDLSKGVYEVVIKHTKSQNATAKKLIVN